MARSLSPDAWALLAIAAAVIVANLPYLLDLVDPNPLGPRGGLLTSIVAGRLRGQPTIDPNNGFASQAIGHLAALDVLHLRLPWWNPFEGTGMPLLGETQAAALFPPTWLTAISNGQLYEHILLEFVAGLCTYRLLRRLDLMRWAATAGAIAFALDGTFSWFSHATVNPVALLPMLLLGIEHAYEAARARRHGGWWLMAVAGAFSVYAGFPEVAYIDTLMAVAWVAWRASGLRGRPLRELVVKLALAALTGALLCAPMLVAMPDYFNHANLGLHSNPLLGQSRLPGAALSQLLLPYVFGPIFGFVDPHFELAAIWSEVGGYLSASLLVLALIGLSARGRRGLRLMLVILGLLVFARMYGVPPLLGDVLGWLPGMSEVAFFRYAPPVLELVVIILAAIGLDAVARGTERRRLLGVGSAALFVVIAAAVGARPLSQALGSVFAQRPYYAASVAWGLLTVLAVPVVALSLRDASHRAAALAGVLVLDALVLFLAPEISAPRAVQLDLAPARYLQAHIGDQRFFTLGPLQPNYGSYFEISSLNLNDLAPTRFVTYVNHRLDQFVNADAFVGNLGGSRPVTVPSPEQELVRNLNGYRAAGVSYVLTPAGQALPQSPSTFTLVDRTPSTWIYHLSGSAGYFAASDPGCRVQSASRTVVQVTCSRPAQIIRRETYFPGWSERVDGRAGTIEPYEGLFQAVSVPAGTHTVSFSYTPPNMLWGAVGLACGCLLLLGAGLRSARRDRDRARGGAATASPT